MMNITVFNPLSGETSLVSLPVGSHLSTFETQLYREVIPDAPLGCICYRRLLLEEDNAEDNAEDKQLMRLGELYEEDPSEITVLFDGLEVIAFVDASILYPTIQRNSPVSLVHSKNWVKRLDYYTICFHHREKEIEENSNLVSSLDVFHDVDCGRWALSSSFHCITDQEDRFDLRYVATSDTYWYSSLTECMLHSVERTPNDSILLEKCEEILRHKSWYDADPYWYDEDEFYQAEDF